MVWNGSHNTTRKADGSVDVYRVHKRRDRWHLDEARTIDGVDQAAWLHRHAIEIEEPTETSPEKAALADQFLSVLSIEQRAAVELCIMQGLSHRTAAEMLGISENAVDARLVRARRKWARMLDA